MQPQKPSEPIVSSSPAGPGAIEDAQDDIRPLLEGATDNEYVDILNPLSVDFIAKFGLTKPTTNAPMRIGKVSATDRQPMTEEALRQNFGLDLRNPEHTGRIDIVNRSRIPAGKTMRYLGSAAQVIVNQIVTEILQREGKKLLLADPTARKEVEERIIQGHGLVSDFLGHAPTTVQEQLQNAIDNNQPGVNNEPEFPDLNTTSSGQGTPRGFGETYNPTEVVNDPLPAPRPTDQRIQPASPNPAKRMGRPPKQKVSTPATA